jgi:hypothetical protein
MAASMHKKMRRKDHGLIQGRFTVSTEPRAVTRDIFMETLPPAERGWARRAHFRG